MPIKNHFPDSLYGDWPAALAYILDHIEPEQRADHEQYIEYTIVNPGPRMSRRQWTKEKIDAQCDDWVRSEAGQIIGLKPKYLDAEWAAERIHNS